MRAGAARVMSGFWDDAGRWGASVRVLLAPVSVLYGAAVMVRNAAYAAGMRATHAVPARTVSIGNLRVGGTGKTPLTRWLAGTVRERGVAVAIVTKGYGGARHDAHVVGDGSSRPESDVAASGDEAVMLARTSGVPVVAGRDRFAAASLAVARFGSRLLLCDDAFQHRRLARDLDIVLVDADERGGVRRLLPAGPLREPLRGLARADVVVVCGTGGAAEAGPRLRAGQIAVRVRFAPTALVSPTSAGWEEVGLAALAGQRVLAVSGVARPAPIYRVLREWEAELVHVLEYPDHHPYDARDWQAIAHAAKNVDMIVTTEKDLVKLEAFPFARGKLVALRLGVQVDDPEALLARVLNAPNLSGGNDAEQWRHD